MLNVKSGLSLDSSGVFSSTLHPLIRDITIHALQKHLKSTYFCLLLSLKVMKLQRQEGDINFLFQASINQDVNVDFELKTW